MTDCRICANVDPGAYGRQTQSACRREWLAQAAAGGLSHGELLALLVGDEHTRRDSAGLARRLAAAHFETTCAIEDFDFGYNPDIPAGIIRDLAGLAFLTAGQSVILHGPVGVGKTMLAQALGQLACRRGHSVAFTKTSRLLADLAGGHARDRARCSRPHSQQIYFPAEMYGPALQVQFSPVGERLPRPGQP